jgi:hypothetical protein
MADVAMATAAAGCVCDFLSPPHKMSPVYFILLVLSLRYLTLLLPLVLLIIIRQETGCCWEEDDDYDDEEGEVLPFSFSPIRNFSRTARGRDGGETKKPFCHMPRH